MCAKNSRCAVNYCFICNCLLAMTKPIRIRNEDHLRELHQQFFTVSRLGSLYGDGFTTRWQEYNFLRGSLPLPVIDGEILERGQRMQAIARPWIKERKGWEVRNTSLCYPHSVIQRFAASPDLIINAEDKIGEGVGEVKIVNDMAWQNEWSQGEDIPLRVELQLQGQMSCNGASWGAIIAIVVGTFKFQLHIFEREARAKTINKIEVDVADFLQAVEEGKEPPVDFTQDGDAIANLYSSSNPLKMLDLTSSNRLPGLCALDIQLRAIQSAIEKERKAIKAEVLFAAQDADKVICGDYKINTGTVKGSPDKTIAAEDVGTIVKGRSGYRQCLIGMANANDETANEVASKTIGSLKEKQNV